MKRIVVSALVVLFLVGAGGAASAEGNSKTVFRVSGMTCGMCSKAIERALEGVPGVQSVEIDRDSGRVEVHAESGVDAHTLETAIEAAGSYKADLEQDQG